MMLMMIYGFQDDMIYSFNLYEFVWCFLSSRHFWGGKGGKGPKGPSPGAHGGVRGGEGHITNSAEEWSFSGILVGFSLF